MPSATAPKTLADAKIKLVILALKPVDTFNPTVVELNAGIDASCRILKADFRLGATASDTVGDAELCASGNAVTWGASNFEGTVTPFRYFDQANPGRFDSLADLVYQALKVKGTTLWIYKRESGKRYDAPWAVGDEIEGFEVLTDNPQAPSDATGYIKRVVPLGVQNGFLNATVGGTANATANALRDGGTTIKAVQVTAGGTGYTVAPTVSFTGGAGTGATAVAVVSGGSVVAVDVTAAGTGYTTDPTVVFTRV